MARQLGLELRGEADTPITGVAPLHRAGAGQLSFLSNPRFAELLDSTSAAAVIVSETHADRCPVVALISSDPYVTYARAAQLLYPPAAPESNVHSSAVADASANLAAKVSIGANSVIAANVEIGAESRIGANVSIGEDAVIGEGAIIDAGVQIYPGVRIGARCQIRSGAVIGSDGFGFANDHGEWVKIPQLGSVYIGDDVEIGANTTIDRGALDDTVLGNGVKLDNLIQIAHNVKLGDHTLIAGCTGIAGSTIVGKYCTIGGGVGIVGHIEICDRVMITGQSFVTQGIDKPGTYSSGVPLQENAVWRKNYVRFRSLNELSGKVRRLEQQLQQDKDKKQNDN